MRASSGLAASVVFLLLLAAVPAHAADDNNSAPLTPSATALTPQELASALDQLEQGSNDTQMQGLINQFNSALASGNYKSAASTLLQIQSDKSSSVPPSLKALAQSLSIGANGASIDPNLLSRLLASNTGSSKNQNPAKISLDLQTLASLVQNIDPALASKLLQQSSSVLGTQVPGANSVNPLVTPPGLSNLGLGAPAVGLPSLPVGGPAAVPVIDPSALALPIALIVSALALFLARKPLLRLAGRQALPGLAASTSEEEPTILPSDPRRKVAYYFAKTVSVMGRRGVPKKNFETHREFSQKCETRVERPYVSSVASLYEKAKFSGQEVTQTDADQAASAYSGVGAEER